MLELEDITEIPKVVLELPSKEEKLTEVKTVKDLSVGDRVIVSREVVVEETTSDGTFYSTDNAHFRVDPQDYATTWNVELLERPKPAHWPPQDGDVWRTKNGFEYHVLGVKIMYSLSTSVSADHLLSYNPELVHRRGDSR